MKFKKYKKYIILILLITFILLFRLCFTERYFGHDTIFHTANIIELSKTISIKNIFGSKMITFDCNPFGYGTYFFYPKLPHLLASYLYLITNNIYTSMNIVYFIITFLSGVITFFLSKKIFNNKKIALLSVVIYLTIPYHICEIYIRDAFAENFMFLAVPLIFLGLYELKDNNKKIFYFCFTLGYLIGMYSHLVSMVFCTIFVALFLIYYHKDFYKKDKIKDLIINALIVTGLTLPFLTTVIEYKLLDTYTVFLSEKFTNRYSAVYHTIKLSSYFNQTAKIDEIKLYFNLVTIILLIITTLQIVFKKTNIRKKQLPLLIMIILLINIISSKIIWNHVPEIFLMIQFPWRLLVFLSLFIALYAPTCLLNKNTIPKILKQIMFCAIICLIIFEGINNIKYYSNEQLLEQNVVKTRTAMGYQLEYLPLSTLEIDDPKYFYSTYVEKRENTILTDNDNIKIKIAENNFPNLKFKVQELEENISIELPRVYYLGYHLKDEKGKEIKLYKNENGFLQANITKSGNYTLSHSTTIPEKIANAIGILTLFSIIMFLIRGYKNEKK